MTQPLVTQPTDREKELAQRAGALFARIGRPLSDSPYRTTGNARQRVLARWFARGYALGRGDADVSFDD